MLKKIHRLKRREIEFFFRSQSRYIRGGVVSIRYRKTRNKISRFAFIVSGPKKRLAVGRNLLRRRMAEIVRMRLSKIRPGLDIIFFLKTKDRSRPTFIELKEDVEHVLSRMGL